MTRRKLLRRVAIAGAAAAEEIQKRIKDAAASLRREKH